MAQDPLGAKASERWISLRADKVYGRVGPSREHRILWVYRRRGLPMEVVAETPNWLRLRDPDGDLVWVHVRLTSLRRHVVIASGHGAINLRTRPEPGAPIESVLRNGVVARLESCEDGWCAVQVDGRRGWVRAVWLQGVSPDETN